MTGQFGVRFLTATDLSLSVMGYQPGHPAGNSVQGSWFPSLTPDNSDAARLMVHQRERGGA